MVEYALKIALIAGVAISALAVVGLAVANHLCNSAGRIGQSTTLATEEAGYYDLSQNKCCVAVTVVFGQVIYDCNL